MKFFKKNRKDKNKVVEEEEGAGLYQPPNAQVEMKKYQTKYAEPGFANNPTARPGDGNGAYDVENVRNTKNYDNIEGSYAQMKEDEPDYLAINGEPVYVVKQKRGYLSILFSITQTVTLIGMMVQCNVAPLKINPMVGPYPDALSYWGAKNAYNIIIDKEYWRLFSPILLHAGLFHLLCNVSVQLDTGAFFEREWGSIIWLLVYLGSAASGSILSVIVSPNSIGVGSSGSVCGLFGAKIAEALCRCKENTKTEMKALSYAILCEQFASTLCSVILILVFSFIPFVDWAAHVGGLLGGFLVGMFIFSLRIKTMRWKIGMTIVSLLINLIFFGVGLSYMFNHSRGEVAEEMGDVCEYYKQFYEDYECRCRMDDADVDG